MTLAITRRPSPRMMEAELTHIGRSVIDTAVANAQHEAYRAALGALGAEVIDLPALDADPDCAFVEDVCLALPELFVLTRPGARSRLGEVEAIAPALPADRPAARLKVPATLDGGDVLAVGRTLFVGLSTRTNTAAIEALIELLGPFGYEVIAVEVARSLHLKTAVTALPDGRLLVNPRWVDATKFDARDTIQAPEQEPFGANTLSLGDTVLVQASTPRTAERLMAEGYVVQAIDIGEFAKAEAGLTCMSIIVPGP